MGIVSVCKVPEYRAELLDQAIEQHFSRIHAEEIIRPGMRVLLKPNLVRGCRPDAAVTTRAEILTAVCKKLRSMGVSDIVIADSPGGLYTPAALHSIYSVSATTSRPPERETTLEKVSEALSPSFSAP